MSLSAYSTAAITRTLVVRGRPESDGGRARLERWCLAQRVLHGIAQALGPGLELDERRLE